MLMPVGSAPFGVAVRADGCVYVSLANSNTAQQRHGDEQGGNIDPHFPAEHPLSGDQGD